MLKRDEEVNPDDWAPILQGGGLPVQDSPPVLRGGDNSVPQGAEPCQVVAAAILHPPPPAPIQ